MAFFWAMGANAIQEYGAVVSGGAAEVSYEHSGTTPLMWGGAGAMRLYFPHEVNQDAYQSVFGHGGCRHPVTGERKLALRKARWFRGASPDGFDGVAARA